MAGHQDALCLLDQRATAERALQAVVLAAIDDRTRVIGLRIDRNEIRAFL
jgi:hypothetical protein